MAAFAVHTRTQAAAGGDTAVVALEDGAGGRAEVCPALGFNCFHWEAAPRGRTLDLLYADPGFFTEGKPTRSGVPVLFPFPNRIRDGRFTWDGKEYRLPANNGPNAIHGFACRKAWRVVGQGADAGSAWVVGEFQASRDDPASLPLWPADHRIRVTIRLLPDALRIEAEVDNPDRCALPFGLGYHPYFRTLFAAGTSAADCVVRAPAREMWTLVDFLPSGETRPCDPARDLTAPRRLGDLQLDDVLTSVPTAPDGPDGLCDRGAVSAGGVTLRLRGSPAFRELVVYTPGHRQAFCIEPYTCTTDAINLQSRGVDAGLLTLPPGGRWTAVVEMRIGPNP